MELRMIFFCHVTGVRSENMMGYDKFSPHETSYFRV